MKMLARVLAGFCAALCLAGSATPRSVNGETAALPVIGADLTPRWLDTAQLEAQGGDFPDFTLTDQAGRRLRRVDLDGRIVVASFFFTGCASLCPRLRSAMARVRDAYPGATDLKLLSHSVTPDSDTPAVLAAYARANAIDGEQWRLLTGDREQIERVMYEGYRVPRPDPREGAIAHTEWLVLLDQRQRVRGIYNGTLPIELDWLVRDIAQLRAGAA